MCLAHHTCQQLLFLMAKIHAELLSFCSKLRHSLMMTILGTVFLLSQTLNEYIIKSLVPTNVNAKMWHRWKSIVFQRILHVLSNEKNLWLSSTGHKTKAQSFIWGFTTCNSESLIWQCDVIIATYVYNKLHLMFLQYVVHLNVCNLSPIWLLSTSLFVFGF